MTPKRYRKKPEPPVEAVQWTGENREEVEAFSDRRVHLRDGVALHSYEAIRGDWIVRSDEGAFHVVPAERFQATYDEVADGEGDPTLSETTITPDEARNLANSFMGGPIDKDPGSPLENLRPASKAHFALEAAVLQCLEADVWPATVVRFVHEALAGVGQPAPTQPFPESGSEEAVPADDVRGILKPYLAQSESGSGEEGEAGGREFAERKVVISFCGGPLDGVGGFAPDLRPIQTSEGTYRFDAYHPEGDAEFEWGPTHYPGLPLCACGYRHSVHAPCPDQDASKATPTQPLQGPQVERYRFPVGGGEVPFTGECNRERSDAGPYVLHSDYTALQAQLQRVEGEREDWRGKAERRLHEWRLRDQDVETATFSEDEAVAAKEMWKDRATQAETRIKEAKEEFERRGSDHRLDPAAANTWIIAANYLRSQSSAKLEPGRCGGSGLPDALASQPTGGGEGP